MSDETNHVHTITLGAAMRALFPGSPTAQAVNAALAHEAGDRLLALFETFEKDPAQAMREVERLDVYRARRLLALLLLLTKNVLDDYQAEGDRQAALWGDGTLAALRAAHVGGGEYGLGKELCAACREPLPCAVLRVVEAVTPL